MYKRWPRRSYVEEYISYLNFSTSCPVSDLLQGRNKQLGDNMGDSESESEIELVNILNFQEFLLSTIAAGVMVGNVAKMR